MSGLPKGSFFQGGLCTASRCDLRRNKDGEKKILPIELLYQQTATMSTSANTNKGVEVSLSSSILCDLISL